MVLIGELTSSFLLTLILMLVVYFKVVQFRGRALRGRSRQAAKAAQPAE